MLSPHDAGLVKRDAALPALAILLDPDALLAALRPFIPDVKVEAVSPRYIRYKPRTNCLVNYQFETNRGALEGYAKVYRPGDRDKVQKERERLSVGSMLGPGRIVLEDTAIAVSFFPNDSKLKTLTQLADAKIRRRLLRRVFLDQPDLVDGALQGLRYKPERRYVAQLLVTDKAQAALKFYTPSKYVIAKSNAKAFNSRGLLLLPRLLGHSNSRSILAFEWLDGRPLSNALREPQFTLNTISQVGAALAELHAQKVDRLSFLTREKEAKILLSLADWMCFICPPLAKRVRALAQHLASHITQEPFLDFSIHGDFYAEQVLLVGDTVALLDLDRAARSDPSADTGLFMAHLEREQLRGNLSANQVESIGSAFIEGYRSAARFSVPHRIELYTSAGLYRLLPDPFRLREPNWPERTEAILTRAERLMEKLETGILHHSLAASYLSSSENRDLNITVADPFGVVDDPKMSFLRKALDPLKVERQFAYHLPHLFGYRTRARLQVIRVTRYKPGRRCIIEYDVRGGRPGAESEMTLVGKVHPRGVEESSYRLFQALWSAGFESESRDGVSVPEPLGIIPEFKMWVQRKVSGVPSGELLAGPNGTILARRIAEAAHKLHNAGVQSHRRHTMADELRILHERLPSVAHLKPQLTGRLEKLLAACDELGASLPEPTFRPIHRDFYQDQVLVDGSRLYLLDFDLYCEADPGLDIGNFIGHLTELSLRRFGAPAALSEQEDALENRFVELSGESSRVSVRAYTTLTLVRHIYLSTQFSERHPYTETLLEICEQRLNQPQHFFKNQRAYSLAGRR